MLANAWKYFETSVTLRQIGMVMIWRASRVHLQLLLISPFSYPQQVEGGFTQKPGFPKRGQKRKNSYELNFPEGDGRRRRVLSRGRESPAVPRYSEERLSPSKRRRFSMRNHHSDLTFCE